MKEQLQQSLTLIRDHQRKLKHGVVAIIHAKDRALEQVDEYNTKMEDLMSKFIEEKESLAFSLSDRLSKHKIAKIANDIE